MIKFKKLKRKEIRYYLLDIEIRDKVNLSIFISLLNYLNELKEIDITNFEDTNAEYPEFELNK